jgi:HAMP domain-containing protein
MGHPVPEGFRLRPSGPFYNWRPMKLLLKFNLVLIFVFAVGIGIAGYFSREFLERDAQEQVLQQARLMMGAAGGMRTYTSQQIVPLLQAHQARIRTFLPQTVPAFSATEVFNYLRASYPDYTYKEATLNPTNLRDRAVDWEADIVENFRSHADAKEFSGQREVPGGRSMFLARPIVAAGPCLECHSTPAAAPAAMIRIYGTNNGFDWKLGDTVGAQIVSVPMSVPLNIANRAFRTLMIYLCGLALAALILLDAAMVLIVIRPVSRLSALADEVSKGNFNVPEIPVKGSDEISDLARSFNRMYVSMVKAMRMLES